MVQSFYDDFMLSCGYFFGYFQNFLGFLIEYPITYYVLFFVLVSPMFIFLIGWLQDYISDGIESSHVGRYNPLPPNVYYKEKEGIKGFNRFVRSFRSKRIKENEMSLGRIYKTKTLIYKGRKYRYVTSQQATKEMSISDLKNLDE